MYLSATSERGFGVWFLPRHHLLLPFLPSYILKKKGLIPQTMQVLPAGKVPFAIRKAPTCKGLVQFLWSGRLEDRQWVSADALQETVPSPTGYSRKQKAVPGEF